MNEYFLNGKSVSFDWITAQAKKANISTDEFIKNKKITQSSSKPKKPGFGDSLTIEDANPLFAVAKEATTENKKKVANQKSNIKKNTEKVFSFVENNPFGTLSNPLARNSFPFDSTNSVQKDESEILQDKENEVVKYVKNKPIDYSVIDKAYEDEINNSQAIDIVREETKSYLNQKILGPLSMLGQSLGADIDLTMSPYKPLESQKKEAIQILSKRSDKKEPIKKEDIDALAKDLFYKEKVLVQEGKAAEEYWDSQPLYISEVAAQKEKLKIKAAQDVLVSSDLARQQTILAQTYGADVDSFNNYASEFQNKYKKGEVTNEEIAEYNSKRESAAESQKKLTIIADNFPKYLDKIKEDDEKLSYFKYNYNDVENSIASVIGTTIGLAGGTAKMIGTTIEAIEGDKDGIGGFIGEVGDVNIAFGDKMKKDIKRVSFEDVTTFSDFGKYMSNLASEQLPIYASMYFGGNLGAAAVSLSSGGQKISEMENEEGSNYNIGTKLLAGYGYAFAEFIPEKLGTLRMFDNMKEVLSSVNKESRQIFKENFIKSSLNSSAYLVGKVGIESQIEGGTEVVTEALDMLIDEHLLGKKVSPIEKAKRFKEAYAGGAFMGGGMQFGGASSIIVAKELKNYATTKELNASKSIMDRIDFLQNELQTNTRLSGKESGEIVSEIKDLTNEAMLVIENSEDRVYEMTPKDMASVVDINRKQKELKDSYIELAQSNFSLDIKKSKAAELKSEFDKLEADREYLLTGKYAQINKIVNNRAVINSGIENIKKIISTLDDTDINNKIDKQGSIAVFEDTNSLEKAYRSWLIEENNIAKQENEKEGSSGNIKIKTSEEIDNDVAQAVKADGFLLPNGQAVINLNVASQTGAINVAQHEFLHVVLNRALSNPSERKKVINGFLSVLSSAERAVVQKRIDDNYRYSTDKAGNIVENNIDSYEEEYLTAFIDAIAKGEVGNKTQVKDMLRRASRPVLKLLQKIGFSKAKFSEGQDFYDFLKDYQDSVSKGKISKGVSDILKNKSAVSTTLYSRSIEEKIDKINEKIDDLDEMWANGGIDDDTYNKRREAFENEIDALENPSEEIKPKQEEIKKPVKAAKEGVDLEAEAKSVIKENKGKIASEKVQAAYNAKGVNAAVDIIDLFKPITKALVDKRRDAPGFDRELLTDEIETGAGGILDLVQKYDPAGGVPLAAYINKYLPVRAITASRRVLDKEFSKDVEDQKGLMSTETAEQSFDETETDKPKYKSLLEQNVLEPSFVESIKAKALATLRTLKTRIDAPVSINKTVTPVIAEIKDAMGKQADIDLKTAMGGKKDNQLRSWLLKNKKAVLENMTTTWLMGANGVGGMPQAVQKKVDGKWLNYPDWVDKKIDRESVSTDLAGRTSGADLVRRLPNAVNNVSDAEYLGQVLGADGNPIRGRKESLAKAIAEEISFDIIKEDLANDGELFSAFAANQERLGIEIKEAIKTDFVKQVERGNVKFSLSSKAKIDFENKTNELFDNINLKNNITKKSIEFTVNKTFKEWTVEDKKELIDKFTVYLRSAVQTIGKNFRNKGKKYELKVKESIKAFTEANDDGSAISVRLQTVKPVSENFKNPQHLKDLQEINRDFGVDLLNKFGQKKGLELLASFWYPSVAGRSSEGSKAIFKGSDSFKGFLKDIQSGYDKIIPFESIDISRKSNSVSQNMMSGNISAEQKAIDNKMSNDAWDFTVFAVESFANKIKDKDNGFTNDHLASLLTSLIYERNSALRSAASVAGILMDSRIRDPKKYDYDHSKPSRYVLSRLMDKFVDNKEVDLADVKKDYVVTVIPKTLSNKLTKAGLRSMMPYYYKEGEGVQARLKYATENLENTIKFSKSINDAFNQIIEDRFGIEEYKRFSAVVGKRRGAKKGSYRFFVPPSAEDFSGLLYDFMGKGKEGEATKEWLNETLINPYTRGIAALDVAKQSIKTEYRNIIKTNKDVAKKLGKKTPDGDFTYDQAVRVYLWQKAGYEVPGLTERDGKKLNALVETNADLLDFATKLSTLSRQEKGWTSPGEYWDTETLLSDLANLTEGSNRKQYLQEFIQNSELIFSEQNMNKVNAALGNKWVEAMEDSLFRMKNGTNRPAGSNRLVNQWNNWVNNSTGAIMFFNRRSATLQLISATNFLNWSDNNPIKAATAFANQPQYWKDFATLFNSAKLKERRSGLKTEVSESEIANAVSGASNKAKAAMSYLLKIGFTPTQIADSLAIAGGGATFYRNRVNTYLKEVDANGEKVYTQEAAENKAFEDFSKTSDESQQSSDPSLVSMQQASSLGRLVLAFQNTPQQYMRLTKKAARDLINGRGDWKTNVSKIAYYTAVQNMVFSALQTGLFALLPGFDDDEIEEKALAKNKEEKIARIINSMSDTVLKGSGLYGAIISTLKNVAMEYVKQEEKGFKADQAQTLLQAASISPPIGSKLRKIYSATKTAKFEKDVMDERGFEVMKDGKVNLSPKYALVGNIASGIANIPLDRVYDEVNSISEALDNRNTEWQRIALALGWKTWDVGAENEENEAIKAAGKAKRKQEGIEKGKETRKKTNAKKKAQRSIDKVKRRAKVESFTAAEEKAYMNMDGPQRKAYWEKFDKESE
jgi:hypothetical protein